MSEIKPPDPARALAVAQQLIAVLASEDRETQQRALQATLALLGESGPLITKEKLEVPLGGEDVEADSMAAFFNREGDEFDPSDYAQLCAAYHYFLYGPVDFSIQEIKSIGGQAGVVLPDRLDMTFSQASQDGKRLFQSTGRGRFKPSTTGCVVFRKRWNVKPGRRPKPASVTEEK
jgi:hypothetical protein